MTRNFTPPTTTEPNCRRLSVSMLEKRLCWHRQTIWRKYKADTFPKPHYLGQNRVWWEHEIKQWEAKQMSSQGSRKKVSQEECESRIAETCNGDSYYTKSGSSPPDSTSDKGGAA